MKGWLAALTVVVLACGGSSVKEVEGAIIDLEGDITTVLNFTIVKTDGERLEFVPAADATFHGGSLGHLRDHLRGGSTIRVQYREEGGVLFALEIEDA